MKKSVVLLISIFVLGLLAGCSSGDKDDAKVNLSWTGDINYVSPKNVSADSAENQSSDLESNWWKDTSFYHIWVKSFCDSDNDGCGDFKGIESKLSYIKNDLGCDGIWLSPIFECDYKGKAKNKNMHGYDVKDYYAVNSCFGTDEDLISLINACHAEGIKIIFDYVPNHSGSGNQWFKDSCNKANGKENWYVWNGENVTWDTGMSLSSWSKNNARGEYYWHAFADSQPDLNFYNYEVREEMKNVVRYWLNKGFDGLRIDAVRYLVETNDSQVDTKESHNWFAELREEINKYSSPKFMVCEAWIEGNRSTLDSYFGTDEKPEFNMVLDFDQGRGAYNVIANAKTYDLVNTIYPNVSAEKTYGTFIGNHDEYLGRIGTIFDGYHASIKSISAMSLLRPTVPFIYYGNEIGMKENTSYGSGDIRLRTDLNWSEVEKQKSDSSSILNLNKALLSLRKQYPGIFASGKVTELESCTPNSTNKLLTYVQAYVLSDETEENNLLCVTMPINYCDINYFWFIRNAILPSSEDDFTLVIDNGVDAGIGVSYPAKYPGTIQLENLAPYETRVYYFGTGVKPAKLYSDKRMFLRGSMTYNWGYQEMVYDFENKLWYLEYDIKAGTHLFKFDTDACWTVSYGSGEENKSGKAVDLGVEVKTSTKTGENTNFSLNVPSAGTYKFIFYEETKNFKVERK